MGVLAALFLLAVGAVLGVLGIVLAAALLRVVARAVADEKVGWGVALVTVVVAGLAQSIAMGIVFGADVGVCGTAFGFVVWSAMCAMLTGLRFGQAAAVGLVMAIVQWIVGWLLVMLGVAALVTGALAAAAVG